MRGVRVCKSVKEVRCERICGELEAKENPEAITYKIFKTVFMRNFAQQEKFNFCFSRKFLLLLTKISYWQEEWALGYRSMRGRLGSFLIFANLLWP